MSLDGVEVPFEYEPNKETLLILLFWFFEIAPSKHSFINGMAFRTFLAVV